MLYIMCGKTLKSNKTIRVMTGMEKMFLREIRLQWLGTLKKWKMKELQEKQKIVVDGSKKGKLKR